MSLHDGASGARFWRWWIQHNPSYLLSAACMAVGARLLLVSPHTRAGDLGAILLTLGVLQLYEWTVAGILVMLHRSGRSPEDKATLLLVAGLFWTGPLVATAELTARSPWLGLMGGLAAAVTAFVELRIVRRLVALHISTWSRTLAGTCLALLTVAPLLLRIPETVDGRNEVFLYWAWWVLGILPLLLIGSVRAQTNGRCYPPQPLRAWSWLWFDMGFAATVLATTIAQFVAMNYAFFAHARLFYAAPLLIGVAVVGMELVGRIGYRGRPVVWTFGCLPLIAILLGMCDFDPAVPARLLPMLSRNPQTALLLAAGAAWWFAFLRHRRCGLMHLGNVALLLAIAQISSGNHPIRHAMSFEPASWPSFDAERNLLVALFYAATAYLLASAGLRRSRAEAFAAILLHQIAVTLLVCDRVSADLFIVLVVAGWHVLIALFVLSPKPFLRAVLVPVAFLVMVTWLFDFGGIAWWARTHALAMVLGIGLAGMVWPATPFRRIAASLLPAHVLFYVAHSLARASRPAESFCILGAFLLLVMGALLSWNKQRLLVSAIARSNGQEKTDGQEVFPGG